MNGPFYVKKGEDFVLTEMCRECAFCCEGDGTCGLLECVVLEGIDFGREEEKEDEFSAL